MGQDFSGDSRALYKLSYGLFVLTAREGTKDNGCIINTAIQSASAPAKLTVAVNKDGLTHDMVRDSGEFNVSVLDESAPFALFEEFGFQSGRNADKFADFVRRERTDNGVIYLPGHTNAVFSAKVDETLDLGSHTLFSGRITQAFVLSEAASMTYAYYFAHVKPAPEKKKKGFVCKICGYVYEGDELPADFICPICKHPAQDFEPIV